MNKVFFSLMALMLCLQVFGQNQNRKAPVLHEVNNKEVVQSVYPEAVKVEKDNDYWYRILDGKSKTLGFAMSSVPYCKDVIGYNDVTPVMIITDTKFIIRKVALLSNYETPAYVKRLENSGFFKLWSDKSLKAAASVEIDAYTGATFTAKAVDKNVNFMLTKGAKMLPKKSK
jgi:electron transport complex protein RnfG